MASIRQRTNAEGESTYHVQVRLKGHPTETATFERLTDARKWAQSTEAAISLIFKDRKAVMKINERFPIGGSLKDKTSLLNIW